MIDFSTDPGGLFPRLGRIGKLLYLVNADQAACAAVFGEIAAQYASSLQDKYGRLSTQETGLIRSRSGIVASVQQLALSTVTDTVAADAPAASRSTVDVLNEIRRQMLAAGVTLQAATVGVTVAALGTPTGTGAAVTATKRGDGLVQELMIAETGRLVCVADSYRDRLTAGRERFSYVGEPDLGAGVYDYDWPVGSAANVSLTAVSADDAANTSGNLLANSNFETWSADPTPTLNGQSWVTTGTAGTDFAKNTASPFRGSADLKLLAGGGTPSFTQTLGDAAGTSATLTAGTSYAVNLWAKRDGTVSAGVLTVELVDASGTVIADTQGVSNSFTATLSVLTTSYAAVSGVFRTPAVLPSVLKLRIRVSTALTGANVLIDDVCLTPMTAAYVGGPGLAVFSGAVPFVRGDTWTVAGTNDRGGASYGATFLTLLDRFFGIRASGLLFPTDASPTIPDSLITA